MKRLDQGGETVVDSVRVEPSRSTSAEAGEASGDAVDLQVFRDAWRDKIGDLTGPIPLELPPFREVNHAIPLIDETKRLSPRYSKCPEVLRPQLMEKIEKYTTAGWWEERNVPQASPLLCVLKKNGKIRTVVDCRERNANTVKDLTPFPDQEMIRSDVAKAPFRSKLDMSDAYEQIRICVEDVPKSAFSTFISTLVSNVMQQGDCNAPATFQRLMTRIFRSHLGTFVYVYLDDIFIYSYSLDDHERHLGVVFDILRKNRLYLSAAKVDLYSSRMDCLGHLIDDRGIHADTDKMRDVRGWPRPLNYHDVQRFLGLVNYLAQFMPDVSAYTSPLSNMSKQRYFDWTPLHEKCFESIKQLACRTPILKPIDHDRAKECGEQIFLICDASVAGIGAYYGQGRTWDTCRPAGFMSKKFSSAQLSYRTYEQETIAILEGLMRWEDKFLGRPVQVITDHRTLEFFEMQGRLSNRQIRWYEFLSRFQYKIVYVEGRKNVVADALSRYYSSLPEGYDIPEDVWVTSDRRLDPDGEDLPPARVIEMRASRAVRRAALSVGIAESSPVGGGDDGDVGNDVVWDSGSPATPFSVRLGGRRFTEVVRDGYEDDRVFGKVLAEPSHHPRFTVRDGMVYTSNPVGREVLCIPGASSEGRRVTEIAIDQAHRIVGHKMSRKTLDYIRRWYWWPTMAKDVDLFCKSCGSCQTTKSSTMKPRGLLHSLPIPRRPWGSVGMDFVGPFPQSKGFDFLLIVICRFTSMVHLIPTYTTSTARDIAWLYLKEVVRLHGVPDTIVSDRDPRFVARFWRELHKLVGTKLLMSTAYHPQTDGMAERAVRNVSQVLRTMVSHDQTDWADKCPMAEFAINSTVSSTTEFTPFELNYGWIPTIVPGVDNTPFQGVREFVDQAVMNLSAAHDAIIANRVMQTHHANRRRGKDHILPVGSLVYLSTEELNLPKGRARKLIPKFIGPYPIMEAHPEVSTYKLKLPQELVNRRIHPVFHVSRLKPHVPNDDDRFPHREVQVYYDFGDDPETEWVVDEIIDHRWRRNQLELRVRWNLGDLTWEPIRSCEQLVALDNYLDLQGSSDPMELPRTH